MTDNPIIFSAPMIRALLDGRKTQTRRALRPQPDPRAPIGGADFVVMGADDPGTWCWLNGFDGSIIAPFRVPYVPGDRLWVREHWRTARAYDDLTPSALGGEEPVKYEADGTEQMWGWPHLFLPGRFRQGVHMPRWASRLTLTVTDVRVQRLREISEADAIAEGVVSAPFPGGERWSVAGGYDDAWLDTAREAFRCLCYRIHGPGAWYANPWVAAISFTVERRNIDAVAT